MHEKIDLLNQIYDRPYFYKKLTTQLKVVENDGELKKYKDLLIQLKKYYEAYVEFYKLYTNLLKRVILTELGKRIPNPITREKAAHELEEFLKRKFYKFFSNKQRFINGYNEFLKKYTKKINEKVTNVSVALKKKVKEIGVRLGHIKEELYKIYRGKEPFYYIHVEYRDPLLRKTHEPINPEIADPFSQERSQKDYYYYFDKKTKTIKAIPRIAGTIIGKNGVNLKRFAKFFNIKFVKLLKDNYKIHQKLNDRNKFTIEVEYVAKKLLDEREKLLSSVDPRLLSYVHKIENDVFNYLENYDENKIDLERM